MVSSENDEGDARSYLNVSFTEFSMVNHCIETKSFKCRDNVSAFWIIRGHVR